MIQGKILLSYYNPHLYPIIDEINRSSRIRITAGLYDPIGNLRPDHSWNEPEGDDNYIRLWDDKKKLKNFSDDLAGYDFSGSLGIFYSYYFYQYIRNSLKSKLPYFLFSEGFKPRSGINELAKKIAINRINSNLVHLMAIGEGADTDYVDSGATSWNIHPYSFTSVAPIAAYVRPTKNPLKLLFVGQLIDRKNILFLLESLKEVQVRVHLDIIGSGPQLETCKKYISANSLQHINFRGQLALQEVYSIMRHSDVLILPSKYDGWGAVINEAMASGMAIIASDGVRASNIIENSENGFVYNKNDNKELSHLITSLADNLSIVDKMKANNLKKAETFSSVALAKKLENIICQTVEK